jgi:hypothetical protein
LNKSKTSWLDLKTERLGRAGSIYKSAGVKIEEKGLFSKYF